ncbi:MAG: hypothetical protein AAF138_07485 [Planctomycetota bacterium]
MPILSIFAILLGVVAGALLLAFAIYFLIRFLGAAVRFVGWFIVHLFTFVIGMLRDVLRFVGSVLLAPVFMLLVLFNILLGRWSAAGHFGKAVQDELTAMGACLYRIGVGHPARLLLLHAVTEGLEQRLPRVLAEAPGRDAPPARSGQYDGYTIVGSLAGGGSGGKLYIAEPSELKQAAFERGGHPGVDRVVIKAFSLDDGSSLPQIVRESRALDAAKKLGLVLEHDLGAERFFYVMRYVPGESLGVMTQNLHARSEAEGLRGEPLRKGLGFVADLVRTLDHYHRGGLWHKDVKPDNIICDDDGAHLVDFGLVTPLRSAMTLTTHGTEYFRDPELVRMALKGAKVHEVDGAKFDVYAAGAVLYSLMENSFPAHGGLSQLTKSCPDAIRWIIRRSMTDYDKRYNSASEMLADLNAVIASDDPYAFKPASLPSMKGEAPAESPEPVMEELDFPTPAVTPAARRTPAPRTPESLPPRLNPSPKPVARPRVHVTNWWTGRYAAEAAPIQAAPVPPSPPKPVRREAPRLAEPVGERRAARDQLASARARAASARERAHERMAQVRRPNAARHGINPGVAVAVFLFLGAAVAVGGAMIVAAVNKPKAYVTISNGEASLSKASSSDAATLGLTPKPPATPARPQLTSFADEIDAVSAPDLDAQAKQIAEDVLRRAQSAGAMTQEAVESAVDAFREALVAGVNEAAEPLVVWSDADFAGASVLVIASDVDADLRRCLPETLTLAGADVLDEQRLAATSDLTEQDEIATVIAGALATLGLRALDANDVGRDLQFFVAEQDNVDMLIWLEPMSAEGEPDRARFIVTEGSTVLNGSMTATDCPELVSDASRLYNAR